MEIQSALLSNGKWINNLTEMNHYNSYFNKQKEVFLYSDEVVVNSDVELPQKGTN